MMISAARHPSLATGHSTSAAAAPVLVCAWCPDKAERDAAAAAAGLTVTHGLCEACVRQMYLELGDLKKRRSLVEITGDSFGITELAQHCAP